MHYVFYKSRTWSSINITLQNSRLFQYCNLKFIDIWHSVRLREHNIIFRDPENRTTTRCIGALWHVAAWWCFARCTTPNRVNLTAVLRVCNINVLGPSVVRFERHTSPTRFHGKMKRTRKIFSCLTSTFFFFTLCRCDRRRRPSEMMTNVQFITIYDAWCPYGPTRNNNGTRAHNNNNNTWPSHACEYVTYV